MTIPETIQLVRRGCDPLEVLPATFEVCVDDFGVPIAERAGQFRLVVNDGWVARPAGELRWELIPERIELDRRVRIRLRRIVQSGETREWTLSIPVSLDLQSTFDPIRHTFPEPNRASVLGDILPDREIFEQTYVVPSFLKSALFSGLYADIVFLRRDGPTRGGLCSGMARWAIARSRNVESQPENREQALEQITVYHGRQLRDRALLLSAPWFLRGSPRAAYRAVRGDLLRQGWTDRAFDLAVPKPWRRDVVTALIGEGHTVVPYRILQPDPDTAHVEVYDPNRPPATLETPEVMEFDLENDRYAYRHMVSGSQTNVGLIAARQAGYAGKGTAVLASLASLAMGIVRRLSESGHDEARTANRPGIDFTS